MSARLTRWMPILLAILLGGLIWLLNRAAQLPEDTRAPEPGLPDLIAESARIQRFDAQGDLVSVLTAAEVRHLPQDDTMLFEQPRLEQTRPGQPKITLTGERARSVNRATEVWFAGEVEMRRAADGRNPELLILTRDMHVDTEKQIARASAPVTAEMGVHRVRAVGFVADHRNETLQLLSQVSMTYVPNKRTDGNRDRVLP